MPDTMSICDADPELCDLLDPQDLDRARRETRTLVRHLTQGSWDAEAAYEDELHHKGFLVVDGLVSREVDVMGRRCVELIGPSDVLRPWRWDPSGLHVHAEVGWSVLEPTRLAVLDHGLVVRMTPWPQLGIELFSRGLRRAHALATAVAISHQQRVTDRLLLTLWYLAERWGRVTPDGTLVDLPLHHQRLADLVGAGRPSTTTAMGELADAGHLRRRDDGLWLLHGQPPKELRHHRLAAAELT